MKNVATHPLYFYDSFAGFDFSAHIGHVIHILCMKGSASFTMNHMRYNVACGDYVIFTRGAFVTAISQSDDCRLVVMSFPAEFSARIYIKSKYGIIGHLSLMKNPVMLLSETDYEHCLESMNLLKKRASDTINHLFRDEMLESLLKTHILDLYDIHARGSVSISIMSRPAKLMQEFIGLLIDGDFIKDRRLEYYANRLCITPHYLSEISKNISGLPATYWIDRFVMEQLSRLLMDVNLPLDNIAYRLNFSSVSYLTRYVKKSFGVTPSQLRNNFKHK